MGGTNHGGEDGGGGEEGAREALLQADGDGERGDGGGVGRRHPAGPDQLLRVPPVLLVPARTDQQQIQIVSGGAQIRAREEGKGEWVGGRVPGGEDLDGLRDGEGEHRGDERAVGEHGQVGELGRDRRRWRRGNGGGGSGGNVHGSRPAAARVGSGSVACWITYLPATARPRRLQSFHLPPVFLLLGVQCRGGGVSFRGCGRSATGGVVLGTQNCYGYPRFELRSRRDAPKAGLSPGCGMDFHSSTVFLKEIDMFRSNLLKDPSTCSALKLNSFLFMNG